MRLRLRRAGKSLTFRIIGYAGSLVRRHKLYKISVICEFIGREFKSKHYVSG